DQLLFAEEQGVIIRISLKFKDDVEHMTNAFDYEDKDLTMGIHEDCGGRNRGLIQVVSLGDFDGHRRATITNDRFHQGSAATDYLPDGYLNKAVADGTASFYIDRCVGVQIATATYGIECVTSFDVKLKSGS
ncbi:hypothetical protein AX14_007337, partial [Amanita brunnescens Koide BX004]